MNIAKSKEIDIDFRRKPLRTVPVVIHGEEVNVVDQYKYLGTIFDNTLKFEQNTDVIIKRAHQRQYFLRKLIQCSKTRPTNLLQFLH